MTHPLQQPLNISPPYKNESLFSDHYLSHLLPADSRWQQGLAEAEEFLAWLQALHTQEAAHLASYNKAQLETHWFRPILTRLGHIFEPQASVPGLDQQLKKPDYVFFADETAWQTAADRQRTEAYAAQALAVGEVKQWAIPLGKKLRTGQPSFDTQNPSYQIDYYLRSTGITWGLPNNGQRWRLVHADTSQKGMLWLGPELGI